MRKSSDARLYASKLIVEKVILICATGKLPAGVVAAQKIVISKENPIQICYGM
jgi:hypothetical protein